MKPTPPTGRAIVAHNVATALRRHLATGETQSAFATRTGISQPSVSRYAAGQNTPSPEHLISIAEAIHITLDELVLGKPST